MAVVAQPLARRSRPVVVVACRSDVVLTSLAMPDVVEPVVPGPDGMTASSKPGTVLSDLFPDAPVTAHRCAARMQSKGFAMLEAPVSGSAVRAMDAVGVIMVGGDAATFEAQRPRLYAFSGEVGHVGGIGTDSTANLINNTLAFCNVATAAEALTIG